MDVIEDIARDLAEPETAKTSFAPQPPARTPRLGHRPKIREALEALHAEGLLLPLLRTTARYRLVLDWLMKRGYSAADDLPGRDAVEREHKRWLRERTSPSA
jgi:hypothetical protein